MEIVNVRFATNRNRVVNSDMFGNQFRDGDPAKYVTGSIDVVNVDFNLPDNGWEPIPGSLVLDPPNEADHRPLSARTAATDELNIGIVRFAHEISERESAADFGLVLLPGFASTFPDAMRRAAQISVAYQSRDVFCFSWPTVGVVNLEAYVQDQLRARRSAKAISLSLARLFGAVRGMKRNRPRLSLVGYSMGCYALRHAVQYIKTSAPELLDAILFEVGFA